MKKIKLLSFLFAISLLAVSCSKNNTETIDPNAPVEVKFTSSINVATKAYNNMWEDDDKIGIYMISNGSVLSDENIIEYEKNRPYVTSVPNLGVFNVAYNGNKIYYPLNGDTVDFIAYYPANAMISDNYEHIIDAKEQSFQEGFDLLYSNNAINKSKANANVSLTFDHMLAKVTFTLVAGEGVTQSDVDAGSIIIRDIYTNGTFNLATKALATTGEKGYIYPELVEPENNLYEAIIIPQATTGKVVEFFVGGNVFKWAINKDFESGKKYKYIVTITRTGASVTGTISDWNSPIMPPIEGN